MVHPASLDGALQLLLSSRPSEGLPAQLQLPFSAETVQLLRGSPSGLWAAVSQEQNPASASGRVLTRDGRLSARFDGFRSRLLAAGAAVVEARRWLYELEWTVLNGSLPSSLPERGAPRYSSRIPSQPDLTTPPVWLQVHKCL